MCGSNAPLAGIQGRCAYVPRLPLLILSPFAKVNFVDHDRTDQSSIIRFVEDNWELGRLGGGSLDELAGSFSGSFDFEHPHPAPLVLDSDTGELPRRPHLSIMRGDQAHFVRAKYKSRHLRTARAHLKRVHPCAFQQLLEIVRNS